MPNLSPAQGLLTKFANRAVTRAVPLRLRPRRRFRPVTPNHSERKPMPRRFVLAAALGILFLLPLAAIAAQPELVSVAKIWDAGAHNAFTDLIRWHDKWYCSFREAE